MDNNEYQIGGNHYAGDYQHWDFVVDCQLNYLLGCATKYIIRWKKKNGIEDLRKAVHYISKNEERCSYHYKYEEHTKQMKINKPYRKFFDTIDDKEKHIILELLKNNSSGANNLIAHLIMENT